MLGNVLDVDYEAMIVSLKRAKGAFVFFFGFQAAFPSIAHAYLHKVLTHPGTPAQTLQMITAMYDNNKCTISLRGSRLLF